MATKDNVTENMDLGAAPGRRGRPSTGTAMSSADRQRAYRERLKSRQVEVSDREQIIQQQASRIRDLEAQVARLSRSRTRRHRDDPPVELADFEEAGE